MPWPGRRFLANSGSAITTYERVIRNPAELDTIRRYIANNPARWALDAENPRKIRRVQR